MASRPIHIRDFRAALADQTIPGTFNADRTVFEFPRVESVNARGARLVWQIRVRLLGPDDAPVPFTDEILAPGAEAPGVVGEITTESFQAPPGGEPGEPRAGGHPTLVREGKNLGRANATNPATQALRDALSRYNSQRKRAVDPDAPEPPPMLVKKMGETRGATLTPETFAKGVTVQRKFNGVRLVAFLPRGAPEVRLYSRTKGDYPGFDHIRAELAPGLADPPPVPDELFTPPPDCPADKAPPDLGHLRATYAADRVHLDGEIYLHGKSLQWISGQARREDDEKNLEFYVFDCFFPAAKAAGDDMASARRQAYLDLFFGSQAAMPHVRRVENFRAADLGEVRALADRFVAEKYEGAIARQDCAAYRYSLNNYHASTVVKIKPLHDSEFDVVGYTQGKKGKDVGAVIWVCEVDPAHVVDPADKTFNVVPKDMSYDERYRVYRCLGEEVDNAPGAVAQGGPPKVTRFERDFRGQPLTVEYPERSAKTGKPVQAKALTFRTYEGGPADDPLRRLFAACPEVAAP